MYYEYNHKDGVVGVVPPIDRNIDFYFQKRNVFRHIRVVRTLGCVTLFPPILRQRRCGGRQVRASQEKRKPLCRFTYYIYDVNR